VVVQQDRLPGQRQRGPPSGVLRGCGVGWGLRQGQAGIGQSRCGCRRHRGIVAGPEFGECGSEEDRFQVVVDVVGGTQCLFDLGRDLPLGMCSILRVHVGR
jgi:hypothetical protein